MMDEQKTSIEIEQDKEREHRLRYVSFVSEQIELETKLAELDVQREDTRKRLERIRRVVAELGEMYGLASARSDNLGGLGFTDAVRAVIRKAAPNYISANDIKERLQQGGFDLTQYQNPSASIYTILARLDERKFIDKKSEGFNVLYRWKRRVRQLSRRQARDVREKVKQIQE
jgi:hypothetical protein